MPGQYQVAAYNGLEVLWDPELDGGGQAFGQDFLPVVRHLFGHAPHVYEACAGCGFIGFSLLAHGLCDRLTLSDINPRSVAAMQGTVERNGLAGRVNVYLSDGLGAIPDGERFDLVVSNPPWYPSDNGSLIACDPGWAFHRSFYGRIARHVSPGGSVLFQENSGGAEHDVFLPMLAAGGLALIQVLRYVVDVHPANYFLWSKPLPGQLVTGPLAPAEHVTFELTPEPSQYQLEFRRGYSGVVVNRLGRPVELLLSGENQGICLPVGADSVAVLPTFTLPPGVHRVRDGRTDAMVMTVVVSEASDSGAATPAR
jgi:SAM-dependent methyltransferase